MSKQPAHTLSELLQDLEAEAHDRSSVSIENVLDRIGRRSFGPILVLIGAIYSTPILGDIPGVPTLLGLIIIITGLQLLFGREHFWLPRWLLDRSVSATTLGKTLDWLRTPSQYIDSVLRERLSFLTGRVGTIVIAVLSISIAFLTPAMEIVPLSANVAGAAVLLFGLSLVARDGLLTLIGIAFYAILSGILIYTLIL